MAQLLLARPVKRWVISGAIILLFGYITGYRFLPWRDAGRFRNAELFVHTRDFHYAWEARFFYPAAYIEWLLSRAHPQPRLPHPSWETFTQVVLLEAQDYRETFPRNRFAKRPSQAMTNSERIRE